jgi:nicotinate-nucleotide adenylyltransferase
MTRASIPVSDPLILGGSFNPIHYGHLRTSESVARRLGFDRVLLMPSAQPPHKPASADLAAPADRLAMCQLAAGENPTFFSVSDLEIRRPGPSYTLDTARELRLAGMKSVNWLIGADMVRILPKWHQAQKLLDEVNFIIMARPGWSFDWATLPPEFRNLKEHVVEAPLIDLSATDIRRRVKAGESIEGLTPPPVISFIHARGLYR